MVYASRRHGFRGTKGHPGNKLWGDGWGWSWFDADKPLHTTSTDYHDTCLGCHEPAKTTDWMLHAWLFNFAALRLLKPGDYRGDRSHAPSGFHLDPAPRDLLFHSLATVVGWSATPQREDRA
jgi:hypothetical protein